MQLMENVKAARMNRVLAKRQITRPNDAFRSPRAATSSCHKISILKKSLFDFSLFK